MDNQNNKRLATLDLENYLRVFNNLNAINELIAESLEILNLQDKVKVNSTFNKDKNNINNEIDDLYRSKKIKYKKFEVLKYIANNPYISDMDISRSTSVSYSSISQWKKNDSEFRNMYDKILLCKK